MELVIVDPLIDKSEAEALYGLQTLHVIPNNSRFDVVIAAVPHDQFIKLSSQEWLGLLAPSGVIFDLKGHVPRDISPIRI
jgi:UDP-N-acetyl-D-galactosamine dehydrogenase